MSSSEQYKRQIMNDLAQGDVESLEDALKLEQEYANFDDFAQRSSHDERRQLLFALFIQTVSQPSKWNQNCNMRSPKLSLMNAMMWQGILSPTQKRTERSRSRASVRGSTHHANHSR